MVRYHVLPRGPEWHIDVDRGTEEYRYKKKAAAVSMAENLSQPQDVIVIHRFDGEVVDEYYLCSTRFRQFINSTKRVLEEYDDVTALLSALRGPFGRLLTDDDWLPSQYRTESGELETTSPESGDGVVRWLLYRKRDSFSISSHVIRSGFETLAHDHPSWGLLGVQSGRREETTFEAKESVSQEAPVPELKLKETRRIHPGDVISVTPSDNGVHAVKAVSEEPSVGIHLFGSDIGCVSRRHFDTGENSVEEFHPGYANAECQKSDKNRG